MMLNIKLKTSYHYEIQNYLSFSNAKGNISITTWLLYIFC